MCLEDGLGSIPVIRGKQTEFTGGEGRGIRRGGIGWYFKGRGKLYD